MTQPTEIDRKHVMNIREAGTVVNSHETTRELDSARAKYRGQIIPEPALAVMDAETERLAISNLAAHALKAGHRGRVATFHKLSDEVASKLCIWIPAIYKFKTPRLTVLPPARPL